MYLQHQQRVRRDPKGIIHGRDQLTELKRRREISEIIDGGAGICYDEENALGVAVDLDAAVVVPGQPPRHGVERHQDPAERRLERLGVEEVGRAVGTVEVDARRVEAGND